MSSSSNIIKDNESISENVPKFDFKSKSKFVADDLEMPWNNPLPVSPEFDGRNKKNVSSKYDRSYWEVELLRRHPDLKDLITRVDPVTRAAALGSLYLPNHRLNPQENILSLIYQHLNILGLTKTAASLTESFSLPISSPEHYPRSQLLHHLERGVLSSDRFWSLLLPTPSYPTEEKDIQKQLATQLNATLGVLSGKKQDSQPLYEEEVSELEKLEIDPSTHMPTTGTINKFLWAAVSRPKNISPNYISALAMTYHNFMTSTQLFQKLQECWRKIKEVDPEDKKTLELYFVSFVEKWIETSFYDFDAALITDLTQWISNLVMKQPSGAKRLLLALQKRIQGVTKNEVMEIQKRKIIIPENLFTSDFSLFEVDVKELACQFTMFSAEFYYKITPKELLNCAWSKPLIRHRAPNVIAISERFNALSMWMQHQILYTSTVDERLKIMTFIAKLARELWDMKNYLDGMAVATVFDSNQIFRLNHHKKLLGEEALKDIQDILNDASPDNNFAKIRQIYIKAKDSLPAMPYIGTYLTDLTFTYDGVQDYINGNPNFTKCVKVFDLIDTILTFQQKQFNFVKIDQIQEKIKNFPKYDENELYAKSLQIESEKDYDTFLKRVEEERANHSK